MEKLQPQAPAAHAPRLVERHGAMTGIMNCLTTAWTQHEPELRSWARHKLGNPTDAEDLLQDLFLKALRQGEQFCSVQIE